MTSAFPTTRSLTAFGRRWGLPVLLGAGVGLSYIALTIDVLAERVGDVASGALASLAGIGLGLLVAVFAALFGRLAQPRPSAPADARG